VFRSGLPYAVDCFAQFRTAIYAVFCQWENMGPPEANEMTALVRTCLGQNPTLGQYVAESVDRGREAARIHIQDVDPGFNLAVLRNGAERLMPHEMEALRERFGWTKIWQCEMRYDQLVYPLIFWSGAG
jgi:hypothetical protein